MLAEKKMFWLRKSLKVFIKVENNISGNLFYIKYNVNEMYAEGRVLTKLLRPSL